MTKLIAFAGNKGAGKTYCAEILRSLIGYERSRIYMFADPIKEACKIMFGWTDKEHIEGPLKEVVDDRFDVSPGRALQLLDTKYGRGICEDLWARIAIERITRDSVREVEVAPTGGFLNSHRLQRFDWAIIADCRFINEARIIKDHGGFLFRCGRVRIEPGEAKHESEAWVWSPEMDAYVDCDLPCNDSGATHLFLSDWLKKNR